MTYAINIAGDTFDGGDVAELHFDEAPDVTLSFPGEEGVSEYRCTECGETVEEEPSTTGDAPMGECESTECETCDGIGQIWPEGTTDFQGTESTDCAACGSTGHGAHCWELPAHMWVNSAGIRVDNSGVYVRISVGDPRGAFVMAITRGDDGELRLSVPDVSDSMAHMGLVPLNGRGYFRIVASESPEHVAARNAARELS